MTIVITVPDVKSGGGLSKFIYTLSGALADSGFDVHVVTTHSSEQDNAMNVHNFHKNVVLHSSANRNIVLRYFRTWKKLRSLCPDVIINNYNGVVQYLLPLVPRKVKVIHVIHGVIDDFYRIASINAKYVSAWVTPTPAVANQFNAYTRNWYKQKVFVIPHGVAANLSELNKASKVPELTFVGVLYEHKGAHLLPGIIKGIAERNIPFLFNVVGDGVLRSQLEGELSNEIEREIVHFTGVVPSSRVYEILSRTTIFVYPTQLDSFGLVIAEAMMCGAVPVVSHLEGITDNLVDDGRTGFLVPVDDTDAFVDKIKFLLQNPSVLQTMQIATKEEAEQKFSLKIMSDNYVSLFNSLLNKI